MNIIELKNAQVKIKTYVEFENKEFIYNGLEIEKLVHFQTAKEFFEELYEEEVDYEEEFNPKNSGFLKMLGENAPADIAADTIIFFPVTKRGNGWTDSEKVFTLREALSLELDGFQDLNEMVATEDIPFFAYKILGENPSSEWDEYDHGLDPLYE